MLDKLLKILNKNAHFGNKELAAMLNMTENEIAQKIADYEKNGIIRGYKAIIDWEKADPELVMALIELKVTPKPNMGFEEIGRILMRYDEVESVYLMSGGYDISLVITGKGFKEIANFVSYSLSQIDSVISTATHFVLSRYKENGIIVCDQNTDERNKFE